MSKFHSLCIEFLGCLFSIGYLGFITDSQIWGILGGVRPFFLIPFCCLCVIVLCCDVLRRRITGWRTGIGSMSLLLELTSQISAFAVLTWPVSASTDFAVDHKQNLLRFSLFLDFVSWELFGSEGVFSMFFFCLLGADYGFCIWRWLTFWQGVWDMSAQAVHSYWLLPAFMKSSKSRSLLLPGKTPSSYRYSLYNPNSCACLSWHNSTKDDLRL